jgi:branched-chain amino acid transport system substrate-binding protein
MLAELMIEKYKKVAVTSEQTDFAQDLEKVFVENFVSSGGEIVSNEDFAPDATDFRSILTKIKATNPEALMVNPQTEMPGGTIVKQARELGIDVPIYGTILLAESNALAISGEYAEGMTIIDLPALGEDDEKAQKFLSDYTERYGEPSFEFYLGAAYDDVYIIAQAISEVGENSSKIKDYLYSLKNYSGVIGNYQFDENGDLDGLDYKVSIVKDGKLIPLAN